MKTIKGDLIQLALSGKFDLIVHGCNCFHTMGAGIAKVVANAFPEATEADRQTDFGDAAKLGTISTAKIERGNYEFVVANAYTQHDWRGRGRKVDYDAISQCFKEIASKYPSSRIGYPLIGAGLAGGDWSIIKTKIENELTGLDHTLVVFE